MAESYKWYSRALWKRLRLMVLGRDPICVACKRNASTVADHKKAFRTGKTENEEWQLFCDLNNLQGLCHPCHSEKTAKFDAGFGHQRQEAPTGEVLTTPEGVKYVVSALGSDAIDKALGVGRYGKTPAREVGRESIEIPEGSVADTSCPPLIPTNANSSEV
jgi:5-methylcytosine-specific restriction protein A